MKSFY